MVISRVEDRARGLCPAFPPASRGPRRHRPGGRLDLRLSPHRPRAAPRAAWLARRPVGGPPAMITWHAAPPTLRPLRGCSRMTEGLHSAARPPPQAGEGWGAARCPARERSLMLALGSLAFAAPWLLAALAALPVIWWLLRVTPPAPRRIAFPAIRLLLGLTPREETPARTPWWLILLRTVVAALVILALAHPLLNPQVALVGDGPLALIIDDGWAAARDWSERQTAATDLLAEAERENRRIMLVTTAPLASGEPLPPLAPIRASRRARRGAGAAAEAVARPTARPRWRGCRRCRCRRAPRRCGSATGSSTTVAAADKAAAPITLSSRPRHAALCRAPRRPTRRACWLSESAAGEQSRARSSASSVQSLPAALPRPVDGAGHRRRRRAARAARPRRSTPARAASRCACRCRPNCATGSPASRSKARNWPAPCC